MIFLGATILVEIIGWYPSFIGKIEILDSLKDTKFEDNYWIYNIYLIGSMLFYISYFKWFLSSKGSVLVLNIFSVLFFIIGSFYLIFSGGLFNSFSSFTVIVGTLLIFLSISLYYLELLNSNQILRVYKTMPFYVSVAALLFHLCTTPLFIYSTYFSETLNPDFYKLYIQVIFGSNFLMYTIYIIGFIICAQNKSSFYNKKPY